MSDQLSGTGCICFICKDFALVKHLDICVYVAAKLFKVCPTLFKVGDFVEFKSKSFEPPAELSKFSGVKYKAMSATHIGSPRTFTTTGRVTNVSSSGKVGEFCFVEVNGENGSTATVFCTRITAKPEAECMRKMFSVGDTVRLVIREQKGVKNNIPFRSLLITDMKHQIVKRGEDYDVEPFGTKPPTKTAMRIVPSAQPTPLNPSSTSAVSRPPYTLSQPNHGSAASSVNGSVSSARLPPVTPSLHSAVVPPEKNPYAHYIPYNPLSNELESELHKLRQIAHYMTGYRCNFCLGYE